MSWDDFSERLKEKIEIVPPGDGLQDDTDFGPLIDAKHLEKF